MAEIKDGRAVSGGSAVEQVTKAHRVSIAPRGYAYSASGTTGNMAAALAANGAIFTMRNDASTSKRVFVERIRLHFTTLTLFTVALTAGRRLHLVRSTASSANPSGGTAINPVAKNSLHPVSECSTAGGGDCRIATTAALTVTGTTWAADIIRSVSLSHVGALGSFAEFVLEFSSTESAPIILEPGQVLGIVAGAAFDAGGTFQLGVSADWYEAALWDATTSE